jgi:hypothetical protein
MGYITPGSYMIFGGASNISPADSLTYYFGFISALTQLPAATRMYIPRTGTIRSCQLYWYAQTVDASTENVAFSIRLNNTTDTAIYTGSMANAAAPQVNNALNVPVVRGDYINLKMVCPAWATNPTGLQLGFLIEIGI